MYRLNGWFGLSVVLVMQSGCTASSTTVKEEKSILASKHQMSQSECRRNGHNWIMERCIDKRGMEVR